MLDHAEKDTPSKVPLRSNSDIFIRALQSGHPVEYQGRTWQIIRAGDAIICPSGAYESYADVLVTIGTMLRGNESTDIMMPCDISFNSIMAMCINMTEEERFDIVASQVLMAENTKRR